LIGRIPIDIKTFGGCQGVGVGITGVPPACVVFATGTSTIRALVVTTASPTRDDLVTDKRRDSAAVSAR
jgi:hypothetical protein